MNGNALITNYLTPTLGGRSLGNTYSLALMNMSRNRIQENRNWVCMRAVDNSQSISAGNNSANPIALPSGWMEYLDPEINGGYGAIQLWDGTSYVQLTEVPPQMALTYKNRFGHFWVDIANNLVYILGQCPKAYTVYQFFKKDFGDITMNTSWFPFPSRFHPIIAIRAAARYRLGTSIDDLNANNAADNDKEVKGMLDDMIMWDAGKQLAISENLNYSHKNHSVFNGFGVMWNS